MPDDATGESCDGCEPVPHGSSALALRLALAYSALFLWMGLYLPYWPVWLEHRGMSAGQVGILLAVAPWTRVIASPLAGRWADRSGRSHRLVQGLSVILVLTAAAFFVAEGFGVLLALMVVLGLVFAPIVPLIDGITVGAEAEGHLSYGPVRLWGSGAFIVASWAGGELLERSGEQSVLWLLVGAAGLLALASGLLPGTTVATRDRDAAGGPSFSPRRRPFVVFLAVTGLLHLGHAVLYGFGTVHWRAAGLDDGTVGLLWAEGVLAEIVVFALAPALGRRISPRGLWIVAGLASVLRWSLLASTTALPWLVSGQALHGATFGALHLGAMSYLRLQVPAGHRAHAATLYSAIAAGVALGIGLPLAGVLYEHVGGGAYWAMSIGAGLGLLLALAPSSAEPRAPTP